MSITDLKVQHLYDKEAARARIMDAFVECQGNMKLTAEKLGCHYHTLLRLAKKDQVLSIRIVEERDRLRDAGVHQRGFGQSHRDAYSTK